MTSEPKFRLGEDMATYDNILDSVTFDDLILALHCNVPKEQITPETVWVQLDYVLGPLMQDMKFLVKQNMDKIIEYSKEYYRDE